MRVLRDSVPPFRWKNVLVIARSGSLDILQLWDVVNRLLPFRALTLGPDLGLGLGQEFSRHVVVGCRGRGAVARRIGGGVDVLGVSAYLHLVHVVLNNHGRVLPAASIHWELLRAAKFLAVVHLCQRNERVFPYLGEVRMLGQSG